MIYIGQNLSRIEAGPVNKQISYESNPIDTNLTDLDPHDPWVQYMGSYDSFWRRIRAMIRNGRRRKPSLRRRQPRQ